jgi:hypothetical protein
VADKWIAGAIKNPGSLTSAAKKAGAYNNSAGTINKAWIKKQAAGSGVNAKRAQLATTLAKMRSRK